jgi:zinc transport system substrate-binding protein
MCRRFLVCLLFLGLSPAQAFAAVEVAVSIKPLQLITQTIVGDRGSVLSLMPAQSSPHHFTLSPSDRLAIESSDLIIYVGEELETEFDSVMMQLKTDKNILRLLDLANLLRLNLAGEPVQGTLKGNQRFDPHIWLNTQNVLTIAEEIRDRLVDIDPEGQMAFNANYNQFAKRVISLKTQWQQRLQTSPRTSYMVFHNAFAYFEFEFGLEHVLTMVEDSEVPPGARQMLKVRQSIYDLNPSCLLLDAAANEALISTLMSKQTVTMVQIDLLGANLAEGEGYEHLMENLVNGFSLCL